MRPSWEEGGSVVRVKHPATDVWWPGRDTRSSPFAFHPTQDPFRGDLGQKATCSYTQFVPPHPLALPRDMADELVNYAKPRLLELPNPTRADASSFGRQLPKSLRHVQDFIWEAVRQANETWWRFDLDWTVTSRVIHYVPGKKHRRHADWNAETSCEKLGITIQLSDSDEYEGGDLRIASTNGQDIFTASREKGAIIFWPSWIFHSVSTVKSGERWSFVARFYGPQFR